jgi:dTDP-4-dehydrorhamnose 3,5-epimerase
MHFQYPPHAEIKVVSCLHGEIFDVAVDIRTGSETFLHWHGETLSAANARSLVIPEGFAHGFQTLAPDCELLYLCTAPYAPAFEGGLPPMDPTLGIAWPAEVTKMSQKDRSHPPVSETFSGVAL